jgi:hypothetical protein
MNAASLLMSPVAGHAARRADGATELVVGVTSHRDLVASDVPALRTRVRDALVSLQRSFPDLALTILSPLAEGGDRLVAEAGLALGARLIVPLALPRDWYAEDFSTPRSRAEFEHLVAQGEIVSLPMPREGHEGLRDPGVARDRRYLLSGVYVANHCHLLIALWDGTADGGLGGTAQIVRYYLGGPLPGARRARDNLRQMLAGDDDSLALHIPVRRESAPGVMPAPARWLTAGGNVVEGAMPPDFHRIFDRMQTFEQDRRRYLARHALQHDASDLVEHRMQVVDGMAVHFQHRMNWAMRTIHLLAVAMGLSFLLYSDSGAADAMLWVFLLFFLVGLLVASAAHARDWHRKYVDYRALAEGLRVQSFWRCAGLSMTGDPEFAHDNFMQKQDVELGWIRNVMRAAGLAPALAACDADGTIDDVIEAWVGRPGVSGQLAYYERQASLRARHHRRTRALGQACLWAGVGISLFLALFHGALLASTRNVLVTTMGALSLIAAVREAYAYRKADKELIKQYRFMRRIYRNARTALDAAGSVREKCEILRALGEAALAEHAEWALMHRDRPIEHGRP